MTTPDDMTAALRCGATLHPTAKETARDALVAAVQEWYEHWAAGHGLPLQQYARNAVGVDETDDELFIAYRAYLDAQEVRP